MLAVARSPEITRALVAQHAVGKCRADPRSGLLRLTKPFKQHRGGSQHVGRATLADRAQQVAQRIVDHATDRIGPARAEPRSAPCRHRRRHGRQAACRRPSKLRICSDVLPLPFSVIPVAVELAIDCDAKPAPPNTFVPEVLRSASPRLMALASPLRSIAKARALDPSIVPEKSTLPPNSPPLKCCRVSTPVSSGVSARSALLIRSGELISVPATQFHRGIDAPHRAGIDRRSGPRGPQQALPRAPAPPDGRVPRHGSAACRHRATAALRSTVIIGRSATLTSTTHSTVLVVDRKKLSLVAHLTTAFRSRRPASRPCRSPSLCHRPTPP